MDNTEVIKILKSFLESELADGDKVAIYEQDLEAFNIAIEALKNQEAEKEKWIPVSERLPEEPICDDGYVEPSDDVLVFGDFGDYGVSRYWGNRRDKSKRPKIYKDWVDLKWITEKPIAWMPLPEPYKEKSETEQGLTYTDQDTLMSAT